jgi:hypothetical protein
MWSGIMSKFRFGVGVAVVCLLIAAPVAAQQRRGNAPAAAAHPAPAIHAAPSVGRSFNPGPARSFSAGPARSFSTGHARTFSPPAVRHTFTARPSFRAGNVRTFQAHRTGPSISHRTVRGPTITRRTVRGPSGTTRSVTREIRRNGRTTTVRRSVTTDRNLTRRSTNGRTVGLGHPATETNRSLARENARLERANRAVHERAIRNLRTRAAVHAVDLRAARNIISRQSRGDRRASLNVQHALAGKIAWRREFHNRFDHRHRRRFFAFGWIGPLFWPYAYFDIFDYAFWIDDYYDDPFWDYGYPDIYASLFVPYGYDELVGYSTTGRVRVASARSATRSARQTTTTLSNRLSQMCGSDARDVATWPTDQIRDLVQPTADQRAALDDLANASVKASQIIKQACPSEVALTPVGRLDAMGQRVHAMLQAIDVVRPPLAKFYDSLSDEQKARFNAVSARGESGNGKQNKGRSLAESCGKAASELTAWPQSDIEQAVQPNDTQRQSLDRLKDAAAKAADMLQSACPSGTPITPVARLDAIAKRLAAMRDAVKTVRTALVPFYDSLSDEQKARFNEVGQKVNQARG